MIEIIWNEAYSPKKVDIIRISHLEIYGNLDLSKFDALTTIDLHKTGTGNLDVSGCVLLQTFWCHENRLLSIETADCVSLNHISCFGNMLTTLDVSGSPGITEIWCHLNQLEEINTSGLKKLDTFFCGGNRFIKLDLLVHPALEILHVWQNPGITSLDLSRNTRLKALNANEINIDKLDLSNNNELMYLWAAGNNLSEVILPPGDNLMYISMDGNNFTNLSAFESRKNLCLLSIRGSKLDLKSTEINNSIKAIQAVIDKNEQNPPDGYDPKYTKSLHGFKYDEVEYLSQ